MCVSHDDVKGDNWPICNSAVGRLVFPDRCNLFVWGCVAEHFAPILHLTFEAPLGNGLRTLFVSLDWLLLLVRLIFYTFTLVPRTLPSRRIIWGYYLAWRCRGVVFDHWKACLVFQRFFWQGSWNTGTPTGQRLEHKKDTGSESGNLGGAWIFIKIGLDVRDFEFQFIVDLAF